MIKEIEGYKDYSVDEQGNVWSLKTGRVLKPEIHTNGYLRVGLFKDGKQKHYRVHRLVAETFIPNPLGLPEVNHIDEDKTNNCVDNLEWCDSKYNMNYGTAINRRSKPVVCVELNKTFKSIMEAERELGISNKKIVDCCKGKRKTTGGYHWRYKE